MKKIILALFLLVGCSQAQSGENVDRYDLSYLEMNDGKHLYEKDSTIDSELVGTWVKESEDKTYRSIMVLYPNGTALLLEEASYGFSTRLFQFKSENQTLALINRATDHYGVPYYKVLEMSYVIDKDVDDQSYMMIENSGVYQRVEVDQ